jgi:DNA polymerase-3 subunit epsilon
LDFSNFSRLIAFFPVSGYTHLRNTLAFLLNRAKVNAKIEGKRMLEEIAPIYYGNGIFTAFDLETTGLNAKQDRIVEIGAVQFDKLGIRARFSTLIYPEIPMPAGASAVNNITDAMLKGKPPLDKVLPDFLAFIKNTVLIAHNAAFDCGFINESLKNRFVDGRAPFPALPNRILDTIALAKEAFQGLRRYNLQDLAVFLGIQAKEAHRAEDDARVCMEIFMRCMAKQMENEREG